MKICYGKTRIVLLIGFLAIKIAKINLRMTIKSIYKQFGFWDLIFGSRRCFGTPSYYLFSGIIANWCEWRLYKKSRSSVLMPTYFSLFGLVNIQLAGKPIEVPEGRNVYLVGGDISKQIFDLTNGKSQHHNHSFGETPENYCQKEGKLMIVDYGEDDPGYWSIIFEYGEAIHNKVNIPQ